jgi:hypothetical protein
MPRLSGLGWIIVVLVLGGLLFMGARRNEQPLHKVEKVIPDAALAH